MAGETERSRRKPAAVGSGGASSSPGGSRAGKKRAPSKPMPQGNDDPAYKSLEAAVTSLTTERDHLKGALAAAEARIAALEAENRKAVDRISWVIDSLQSALDE
ncbi:MAG: hypothetical protein R3D27_10440 [Hyphomicrobiaceae bacterium]